MPTKEFFVPGLGVLSEDGVEEYAVPGHGVIAETSPAAADPTIWRAEAGDGYSFFCRRLNAERPSYKNGYARSGSESAHPGLWKGLVGAWGISLGETGDKLIEQSGRASNGVFNNLTEADWITHYGHKSVAFGGSNERIEVTPTVTGSSANRTFVVWVNRDGTLGAYDGIIHSRESGSQGLILSSSSNSYNLTFMWEGGADEYSANTGLLLALDEWQMAALQLTPTKATVWLDLETWSLSKSYTARPLDVRWNIGQDSATWTRVFDGKISDSYIWDRTLTDNELRKLYRLGPGGIFQRRPRVIVRVPDLPKTHTNLVLPDHLERPSYKNGYARDASEAVHSALWKGLVGAWSPSLGNSGITTLHDISGKGRDGTFNGVEAEDWKAGREGHYIDCGDANEYVECFTPILPAGVFSASAWINMPDTSGAHTILSQYQVGTSGRTLLGITGNEVRCFINPGATVATAAANFSANEWILVTWQRDANDNLTMWVNGVLEHTEAAYSHSVTQSEDFEIVHPGNLGTRFFDGLLSTVLVYDRPLASTAIAQIYRLGPGGIFERKRKSMIRVPELPRQVPSMVVRRTPRKASYKNGYARNRGESAHPGLWKGLVGAWGISLGETGDKLIEQSGRASNGVFNTLTEADWITHYGHKSVAFGGSAERIEVTPTVTGSSANRTFVVWVNRDGTLGAYDGIIHSRESGSQGLILSSSRNSYNLTFMWEGGADEYSANTGLLLALDEWQMAALQLTPTKATVWLDLETWSLSKSYTARPLDVRWNIGQDSFASSRVFDGKISDSYIWDRTLTDNELRKLYRLGPGGIFERRSTISIPNPPKPEANIARVPMVRPVSEKSPVSLNPNSIFAKGLVGWWPMGARGSFGTGRLRDLSPQNSGDGTFNGGMDAATDWGIDGRRHLQFDGVDDYVDTGSTGGVDQGSDPFSLGCWFRKPSWSGVDKPSMIAWGDGNTSPYYSLSLHHKENYEDLRVSTYDGATDQLLSPGSDVVAGQWHHAFVTHDGGTTGTLYLDGEQVATGTLATATRSDGKDLLQIGGGMGYVLYNGHVDDARLYNRTLSAGEVRQLYRETRDGGYGSLSQRDRKVSIPVRLPEQIDRRIIVRDKQILRPSYRAGYAKTREESLHSELWRGLVGAWSPSLGRKGDGLTLYDESGEGNDGTLTNMSVADWVVDNEKGHTLDFDGVDGHVSLGTPEKIQNIGSAVSFSAWCYAESLPDEGTIIDNLNQADGYKGYFLGFEKAPVNQIKFILINTVPSQTTVLSSANIVANKWYHVVGTWDGVTMRLYINNVLDGEGDQTGTVNSTKEVLIGKYGAGSDHWDGYISEVLMYDRPLSIIEIDQLHSLGPGGIFHRKLIVEPATQRVGVRSGGGSKILTGGRM